MFRSYIPSFVLPLIILLSCTVICFACTPKKLSNNYGDNKTYADEDSSGDIKSKEKNAKMPFDTSNVMPKVEKLQPKYDNE